jgi:hypothetical protein
MPSRQHNALTTLVQFLTTRERNRISDWLLHYNYEPSLSRPEWTDLNGCTKEQVLSLVVRWFEDDGGVEMPYDSLVTTAIIHLIPQFFNATEIADAFCKSEHDLQGPMSVLLDGCLWEDVDKQKAIIEELLAHPKLREGFGDGIHKLQISWEVFSNLAHETELTERMEVMFSSSSS